jgi:hypothetical protein
MNMATKEMQDSAELVVKPQADVTLYAFPVQGPEKVVFALGSGAKPLPNGIKRNGNNLTFEKTDGTIDFVLDDNTKLHLRFEDKQKVISSVIGTDCPGSSGNSYLPVLDRTDNTLKISNGGSEKELSYSIWLLDKHNKQHCFDPIIKNRA